MSKRILMHDQTVNSYGLIVLTNSRTDLNPKYTGIDMTRFNANPVMLHLHDQKLLLGKWSDVQKDGDTYTGVPVFNEGNDYAVARQQEYESGNLKGASMSFDGLNGGNWWDDVVVDERLGFGETPVLVRCEASECTLCPIPSNASALQMKVDGKALGAEEVKQRLQLSLSAAKESQNNQHTMADLKLLKKALKLDSATGDDDTIAGALSLIKDHETLSKKLAALELSMKSKEETDIKELLDEAQTAGKFTAEERSEYEDMAKLNLAITKKTLGLTKANPLNALPTKKPIPTKPLDLINRAANGGGHESLELSEETYDKLQKNGGLLKLKKNDPETFEALNEAKKQAVRDKGIVGK